MCKTKKTIDAGETDYLISTAEEYVDADNQLVLKMYFDGHPNRWRELQVSHQQRGVVGDPWPGPYVNEPVGDELPNAELCDLGDTLLPPATYGRPPYREWDLRATIAWVIQDDLDKGVWVEGYYNKKVNMRTVSRVGYKSNQFPSIFNTPAPEPVLKGRDLTRYESEQERQARADERARNRMSMQQQNNAHRAQLAAAAAILTTASKNFAAAARARAGKPLLQEQRVGEYNPATNHPPVFAAPAPGQAFGWAQGIASTSTSTANAPHTTAHTTANAPHTTAHTEAQAKVCAQPPSIRSQVMMPSERRSRQPAASTEAATTQDAVTADPDAQAKGVLEEDAPRYTGRAKPVVSRSTNTPAAPDAVYNTPAPPTSVYNTPAAQVAEQR
ncbi:hypothetical protein B484DRAFT_410005 [Ochromonadaceae sp. CCMP2298]|nr:hypothetical protein B484DRAFT_410005 [Ochromonadaceae sp. CCMP2298]